MNDLRWTEAELAQITSRAHRPIVINKIDRRKDHDARRLLGHALLIKSGDEPMPWDRTERRSAARPASDGPRTDDVQDALSRMVEALPRFEVSHWPPTGRPSASHEVLSDWPRLGASDTEEWPWGPAPGDEPRDIQHDAGVATRSRRDLRADFSAFYAAAETFRDSSGSGPHRILGTRADWVIIDEYTSIPDNDSAH